MIGRSTLRRHRPRRSASVNAPAAVERPISTVGRDVLDDVGQLGRPSSPAARRATRSSAGVDALLGVGEVARGRR